MDDDRSRSAGVSCEVAQPGILEFLDRLEQITEIIFSRYVVSVDNLKEEPLT
jgi:hypothetical protein